MKSHKIGTRTETRWIRYRTPRELDFSDFDEARAVIHGDSQLDYLIGPIRIKLEFPELNAGNLIDFREVPFPSDWIAGVGNGRNNGIWKEMGLTTLGG